MDTIDGAVMTKAGELLDALDRGMVGDIHTVTVTLDGRTGGCMVTAENGVTEEIVFHIKERTTATPKGGPAGPPFCCAHRGPREAQLSTSALPARSILRHYRAATDEARELGSQWYDAALAICREAATEHDVDLERAVCALAHLSSRLPWTKNVEAFSLLLAGEQRPAWVLTRSWRLGSSALSAGDPWLTFSRRAPKTRSFARAILGDREAVTVDVWAARVANVDPEILRRPKAYREVAEAYRRAARRVGVSPRELQAITWCEIRGRAA